LMGWVLLKMNQDIAENSVYGCVFSYYFHILKFAALL
jgi:hypothetical protein